MNWKAMAWAAGALAVSHAWADEGSQFKDRREQESYAIGAQTGRTLKADKGDVDIEMMVRGLKDGYGGSKLRMSEDELKVVMNRVQQELHKNLVLNRRAAAQAGRQQAGRETAGKDPAATQPAATQPAEK
jgi:FKBP-type peptidyl-prolyl cis-trans isomerase FklB